MLLVVLRDLYELLEDQPRELLAPHLDHLVEEGLDARQGGDLDLEQFVDVELGDLRVPEEEVEDLGLDDVHDILPHLRDDRDEAFAVDLAALEAEELLVDEVELDEGHDELELVGVGLLEAVEEVAEDAGEEGAVVLVLELLHVAVAAVLADQHVHLLQDVDADVLQAQLGALRAVQVLQLLGVDVDLGESPVFAAGHMLQLVSPQVDEDQIGTAHDR